jgi:hypothetical protein
VAAIPIENFNRKFGTRNDLAPANGAPFGRKIFRSLSKTFSTASSGAKFHSGGGPT